MKKEDPGGTSTLVYMDEGEKEEAKYIWRLNYDEHAHKVKDTPENMEQSYIVFIGQCTKVMRN